jgi:transmembrane protein TMEM260 (protein O-mannosyltransferase)
MTRARSWAAPAAVFAIVLAVYGATLLRGVSSFDAAEMQVVPPRLGIAHPTGYPLWTLLGFAWTKLFFFASPALMMNLLSATLFALAAASVTLAARELDVRPSLAAVAGVVFAFAGEVWARATQAEVHALHTLFVGLFVVAWLRAERTGSRRAALAMVAITAVGLTHHRLMALVAFPVLAWYFLRNRRFLGEGAFLVDCALGGLAAVVVYLYIPLRLRGDPPVVNSDPLQGSMWIIRGDAFSTHEHAFERGSLGNWWHALPGYGDLAVSWLGWGAVLLAVAGAGVLAARRRPVFVGLALVMLASTWGLANRTDRDLRWLIVPLLVSSLCVAFALEAAARALESRSPAESGPGWGAIVATAAVLVPVYAVATHYSTYDRSGDRRDAATGMRILDLVEPGATIWSYWDVRETLLALTLAEHVRPDVTVLDDRAYRTYGQRDTSVVVGAAEDAAAAGRPFYVVSLYNFIFDALTQAGFRLEPVATIELPSGFDDRFSGTLNRVTR